MKISSLLYQKKAIQIKQRKIYNNKNMIDLQYTLQAILL